MLDAKPLRTPARAPLVLPTRPLAEAIAAEWAAQEGQLRPGEMHRTQLAVTAIDRVAPNREAVIDEVTAYGGTDLLCYRAEAPLALAERQHAVWQPHLDWCAVAFDAPLAVTRGIIHRAQSEAALASLRRAVAAQDDLRLTALHTATVALGSLVLGLALIGRRIDAEEAFAASVLDEDFQIERWGEDAEAARRRAAIRAELAAIADFVGRLAA
ncbi:MAG TPA: ATP12 family protein [Alphaproteobacteria bacterium]|nr:ATP12 family protein [Alphaproteobacteria bacterium]